MPDGPRKPESALMWDGRRRFQMTGSLAGTGRGGTLAFTPRDTILISIMIKANVVNSAGEPDFFSAVVLFYYTLFFPLSHSLSIPLTLSFPSSSSSSPSGNARPPRTDLINCHNCHIDTRAIPAASVETRADRTAYDRNNRRGFLRGGGQGNKGRYYFYYYYCYDERYDIPDKRFGPNPTQLARFPEDRRRRLFRRPAAFLIRTNTRTHTFI